MRGVDPWVTTTSLPGVRGGHTSVAYSGYVYVIGGYDGLNTLRTAYYARIQTGGVGSWIQTTSLPVALRRLSGVGVVYNGRVYVPGGYTGTATSSATYYASLSSSGGIGTWSSTTASLPQGVERHAATVDSSGTVYVIGGDNGGSSLNTVYSGVVQSNGNILSWASEAPLPAVRVYPAASTYGRIVYVSGGGTSVSYSTAANTVYRSVPELNPAPNLLLIPVILTFFVRPHLRITKHASVAGLKKHAREDLPGY
jgi:hypothetical protein